MDGQTDDNKIHAFNIMQKVFSDAQLRHDVYDYIQKAMIVSMKEFKSDSWSIRNSALMNFTALIRRLLDEFHIQNQDLSKKRGFTILDLLTKFEDLMNYFTTKLQENSATGSLSSKSDRDKQDLTIFSILLLTSRLVPFSFFRGDDEVLPNKDTRRDQYMEGPIQDKLKAFIELIKTYSASSTYFVRKISAQAMLPLLKFVEFIPEIKRTLEEIKLAGNTMKQNQAHGLVVRVQIFMEAYFKYRSITQPDGSSFAGEEKELLEAFMGF